MSKKIEEIARNKLNKLRVKKVNCKKSDFKSYLNNLSTPSLSNMFGRNTAF